MPGAEWFPGARLNYAQNVLAKERKARSRSTTTRRPPRSPRCTGTSSPKKVRVLATQLRSLGVQPGDRVASTLPNIPEAVIAMLAVTSIGAIWTSVSPDFGWRGVLDRFRQLQPRVLICTGGYRYNGKAYDRSGELTQIVKELGCIEHVIYLPFRDIPRRRRTRAGPGMTCSTTPRSTRLTSLFTTGPFGMPLWILFSSGTTGLPKAITHSHGGILLEQLKLQRLNMDLKPGDVLFFYTTHRLDDVELPGQLAGARASSRCCTTGTPDTRSRTRCGGWPPRRR